METNMRLRNVPGAREAMIESEYTVNEPKEYKGRWSELFGNDHPIRIEVGMGKGRFIMQLAAENPDINYVGINRNRGRFKGSNEIPPQYIARFGIIINLL